MDINEVQVFSEMRQWARKKLLPFVGYRVNIIISDKDISRREIVSTVVDIDPSGCIHLLSGNVIAPESIHVITKLSSKNL